MPVDEVDQLPSEAGDPAAGVVETSAGATRLIRWWPMGAGLIMLVVVCWAFATAWVGIWGSHAAGLITLVVAALAGIGLIGWSLLGGPPRLHSSRARWLARFALVAATALLVMTIVYTRPLPAQQIALDALADGDGVTIAESWTTIRLQPDEPLGTAVAFYPGAKVDPQAYAHVLRPVAEAGYPVVIFKQPYNLAILDGNAADSVIGDADDEVDRWVVGGHSLGGAMAARHAENPRDELVGLLLYAAYPLNDMSTRSDLAVVSVSATNDGLAEVADIEASVAELPPTAEFVAITGAIHSFFGDYGTQNGDGTPTIPRRQAQDQIAEATLDLLASIETGS